MQLHGMVPQQNYHDRSPYPNRLEVGVVDELCSVLSSAFVPDLMVFFSLGFGKQ